MKSRLLLLFLSILLITPFSSLFAQVDDRGFELDSGFDPNIVLTDNDIFTNEGMTYNALVSFMRSKGTLANYRTTDIDGVERSAPEIIWRMSNMFSISPKYLLALLQKEQSLVEDTSPSEDQYAWAAGFGVCDACAKDDPSIQDFRGFANQLYYASRQMREKYYMSLLSGGETRSGYAPGRPVEIDGIMVTPANNATAALYTYTPHIHGNLNLWRIWTRWFSKQFPDGSVVKGIPSGDIWWIRYGVKRPFESLAVASSLVDLSRAMEVSDTELSGYEEGDVIKFPNYALLKDPSGKIWLLVDQERRHIVNMETFRKFGFNADEVEAVTDQDLAMYTVGDKITVDDMSPMGTLVQVQGLRAVWYAQGSDKQLLTHPAYLSLYFPGQRLKIITQATLDALETKEPYNLKDGELVKTSTSPAVFVMEHGLKRLIASGDLFEEMGWKWKNVKTIPSNLLDTFEVGDPVSGT